MATTAGAVIAAGTTPIKKTIVLAALLWAHHLGHHWLEGEERHIGARSARDVVLSL